MTYQERMDFYPPLSAEGTCFYCEDDISANPIKFYPINMQYRPRMKDVAKGLSPAGSLEAYCHIPICEPCFHKLDVAMDGVDNINLVGWDWWDAVDGMPEKF